MKKVVCSALLMLAASTNAALLSGVNVSTDMSLNATHAATMPGNSWVSANGKLTGNILFDFGLPYSIRGFSLWNQNSGGSGVTGSSGINNADVLYSLDGIMFSSLTSGMSAFARMAGNDNAAPQVFTFSAQDARYIQFDVQSNHGDSDQTGLAEVAFDGVLAVPTPTNIVLLGFAVTGFFLTRKAHRPRPDSLA